MLGFQRERDEKLLATWAHAVCWAAMNSKEQSLFSWYDQGALLWAVQYHQLTDHIAPEPLWNWPACKDRGC